MGDTEASKRDRGDRPGDDVPRDFGSNMNGNRTFADPFTRPGAFA